MHDDNLLVNLKKKYLNYIFKLVGMEGVEPPRLTALGSKPSVSTSSTTSPETAII